MSSNLRELSSCYGLSMIHPAMVEIASLQERVAALEKELGRPFVVENGPWTAAEDGKFVESDDFTHDVRLYINGDFGDETQRKTYAEEIARQLNRSNA